MLSVENLSIGYSGNAVFRGLSLEMNSPGFVAVCGLNGCGKSSLLKAICRKIDYVGNVEVSEPVGYLAQSNHIGFNISVSELLLMGRFRQKHFLENYSTEDQRAVRTILSQMGIENVFDKDFQSLSGGQQQLIWIAQTLLQDLPVYLFDEPTQNLDIRNKVVVLGLLQQLAKQGRIVVCVTHDLEYLDAMTGKMLNLSKPSVELEDLSPEVVRENIDFLKQLTV